MNKLFMIICVLSCLLLIPRGNSWCDETDLLWSTFLGGDHSDIAKAIAVDQAGCVYIGGATWSDDFPTTPGAYDTTHNNPGVEDLFVTKLNPSGNDLLYSTYLGGGGNEYPRGIAVDGNGCVLITGATSSGDFPTTPGAFDTTREGTSDAYIVQLSADGSQLDYSTLLGGNDVESGYAIALDDQEKAVVTGWTSSADFPTTAEAYDTTLSGTYDAFISKLDPDGESLEYSTFLGGSSYDESYDIAVAGQQAFICGATQSTDFPTTPTALCDSLNGIGDAFVAALDLINNTLDYSTYLGGSEYESGEAIAVDEFTGISYLTGITHSGDFPVTPGAFDTTDNGSEDIFVARLSNDLVDYRATYLGADSLDIVSGIALDGAGNIFLCGHTRSYTFPVTYGAYDTTLNGERDLFIARISETCDTLLYATFLGGSDDDEAFDLALDEHAYVYVTGQSWSTDFPTTAFAYDTSFNGPRDAFISKLNITGITAPPVPIDGLTITLAGEDSLMLSWPAVTLNTHDNPIVTDRYIIYRNTAPDFSPGPAPFDSTAGLYYFDKWVVGDFLTQYYYSVTSRSDGLESEFSTIVGEFDKDLISE